MMHSAYKGMPYMAILLLLSLLTNFSYGLQHHHSAHDHHHAVHHGLHQRQRAGQSVSKAEELVAAAHRHMAVVNKLRLEHVVFNNYSFQAASELISPSRAAPSLDEVAAIIGNSSSARLTHGSNSSRSESDVDPLQLVYSIPPELVEAARLVAESAPPTPAKFDYASLAKKTLARWDKKNNDTNAMPQALLYPDGLTPGIIASHMGPQEASGTHELKPRATSEYWLANFQQRGASPFAQSGYKVWRNVLDYGAKGDGIADDTAAINKAISDGNRCGANCGSSTIRPAVIFFPRGKYLVSSPIIQYYNTQFLGDPTNLPIIIGASSFVGLGVITSDVYIGDREQWYLNTNNFLRSIKNFVIDITRTPKAAEVCAIHWQVAQGTSLENIQFHMSFDADTTQQGVYMENGSGGFLSNLLFLGGKFGAYFGNQQFTTNSLVFTGCQTALQVHWDWAWTMSDIVVQDCQTGMIIVGGAGGEFSTGQGVGSFILMDSQFWNTPIGIKTSLYAENSTALLIQNVAFHYSTTAIMTDSPSRVLLAGGSEVLVESWGFGKVVSGTGAAPNTTFIEAKNIPFTTREPSLLGWPTTVTNNYFSRPRPNYDFLGNYQVLDVKAMGARGDGVTDDTAILNSILAVAANMSSIVYFPFGVYIIKDTLTFPVGSRILGQAWSQIMATGTRFSDMDNPRVAVKIGNPGDFGVMEIQNMMFTATSKTAGAILVEWNVHESVQGSAGMWDTHIRVGGAIGSNLQVAQCPKLTGKVNLDCMGPSLLLHLTKASSAYLENVWVWTADHDLDRVSQDQIDVYVGRGILIESQGPTWLYGTASEHNVMYQYQLSGAQNIFMGMIQTESPYFQPAPRAPKPFKAGVFPNDPSFTKCASNSLKCAFSWALRIVDSSNVFLYGAGLYHWYNGYSQTCVDKEDCQERTLEVEESSGIWIYNIITKGVVEMMSPTDEKAIPSAGNKNGFMASILAWIRTEAIGRRSFPGFQVYNSNDLTTLTSPCKTALTQTIKCDDYMRLWTSATYRGSLYNTTLTNSVCDVGCGESLRSWFTNVQQFCAGQKVGDAPPTLLGGYVWAGYNETCLKEKAGTNRYCNDIFETFTEVEDHTGLPNAELCSDCYINKLRLMQSSSYSSFDEVQKAQLEWAYQKCGQSGPTNIPPRLVESPPADVPFCVSGKSYATKTGDTCTSIALSGNFSSAALRNGNPTVLYDCSNIPQGSTLCLPLDCGQVYRVLPGDTCSSIEIKSKVNFGSLRKANAWIDRSCSNLQGSLEALGSVVCLGAQGGTYTPEKLNTTLPEVKDGYSRSPVEPPTHAIVADGTTYRCGKWHTVADGETCAYITTIEGLTIDLFRAVNPSVSNGDCTSNLAVNKTYCVSPNYNWNITDDAEPIGELPGPATSLPFSATRTSTILSTSNIPRSVSSLIETHPVSASASATPTNSVCGVKGYDNNTPTAFAYSNAKEHGTVEGCAKYCQSQSCASFGSGNGECLLYNAAVTGNLNENPSSLYAFYDISCITIAPPPATSETCSLRGYDKGSPAAFLYSTAVEHGTSAGCLAYCKSQTSCLSFGTGNGECLLYTAPAAGNVNDNPTSPYVFYDATCSVI